MARREPDHDHRQNRLQIISPRGIWHFLGFWPLFRTGNVILAGFFGRANRLAKSIREVASC
jgi:hypothetical protein